LFWHSWVLNSCLIFGKCSTTWTMSLALFNFFFQIGSPTLLKLVSHCCLPISVSYVA
jgi:hypothetical protein